ncbi:hypothetical protein N6H18_12160 [Reichenbachiella agarivorans]|uniref:Histidine kinase n=1 Tax=Reichenbachiella agarivorans TaxID=2979464 RepID=A0ABY6CKQ7_9BACT|nr:hypothetical protein [Reichenbachiella agarivorans]UXP31104.1 hypothetical protein N6H18_12160 [Reichenbachiella agarivorans]
MLVFLSGITAVFLVKETNYISIPVSVLLILLSTYNWVISGGLLGVSDANLVAILIIVAMINKGKILVWMVSAVLFVQFALIATWNFSFEWLEPWVSEPTTNLFNYRIMALLITIGMVFLAFQYNKEKSRQLKRRKELSERMNEMREENQNLFEQEKEMVALNKVLENKILIRKEELLINNRMIENYLNLSLTQIEPSMHEVTKMIENTALDGQYSDLLKQTGDKLTNSFETIQSKVMPFQ